MKRYLYLWHRWLGIVACLFMALWFISGVVMLYVGYPKLTPAEHLAHLPALVLDDESVGLEHVLRAVDARQPPSSIRLTTVAGAPRYILEYPGLRKVAVDALSGLVPPAIGPVEALAAARQFAPGVAVEDRGAVSEDMWSLSRGLDADRPLHRVAIADAERRLLYVSASSGEVVRDATASERGWNWIGAWLHWLYPLRGIGIDGAWGPIVTYLSLAATLMTVLGLAVGVLRWRFKRTYRNGSHSPYQGFARWHHLGGMLFGVLAITWIFSGLMSMNPWKIFSSAQPLSVAAYQGAPLSAAAFPLSAAQALRRFADDGLQARELEWRMIGGQGYVIGHDGAGRTRILSMAEDQVLRRFNPGTLQQAAWAIRPQQPMLVQQLAAYDFYYYAREPQSMMGHMQQRLPVLRVCFDDPAQTWLHLDLYTGAVVGQLDQPRRASRWLFALLHSWDWLPLLANRPLWDLWMLLFSAGGLLISVSGVVLGWRRLGRSLRPRRG
ncbi:PepSY domain-containing protein [Pseudomonas sp. Fl4BN1]|uniref:PepSY domain-containing protein n=1 Tax=Pseudomonas sp. Fl4BN1 TaxID=2697651 RepID=UPI001378065E|nr:PepSY domain-containing protein [Pseudomonas sp. Fl4BN1]NBF13241.1 PepSY domain-containing protein [Pseudomonas sp. Fl4BN1]